MEQIPPVEYAFINGSGTWAGNFPEDCADPDVTVLKKNMVIETPYGKTVPLKLIHIEANREGMSSKDVLVVPMHGTHYKENVTRLQGSNQIFWVLQQAGVKKIVSEASVGGINPLLEVGDILIPHDFIEGRTSRGMAFCGRDMRMRDPFCPEIRSVLIEEAKKIFPRVMKSGVSISAEGPRFETVAEIQMMHQWGADIVGHTITPEIYYARTIGACFGIANIISNGAEGVGEEWDDIEKARQLYRNWAVPMGKLVLNAMKRVSVNHQCTCHLYAPVSMDQIRPVTG